MAKVCLHGIETEYQRCKDCEAVAQTFIASMDFPTYAAPCCMKAAKDIRLTALRESEAICMEESNVYKAQERIAALIKREEGK